MWIYHRTSWVLPCREHEYFESKTISNLSMFPFIHILSGKYLTSILTIPRPAIRHRTLRKGSSCTLPLFNQCGTWLCHPQGVLSTWGYGIERRQSVCGRSASADLQSSCIDLGPRTCAGLSSHEWIICWRLTSSLECCPGGPCWGGTSPTPGSSRRCCAGHGIKHRLPEQIKDCQWQFATKSKSSNQHLPSPGSDPS